MGDGRFVQGRGIMAARCASRKDVATTAATALTRGSWIIDC